MKTKTKNYSNVKYVEFLKDIVSLIMINVNVFTFRSLK